MTMFGWTGKVLRVDLTNLSSSIEDLDRKAAEQYIGGLGLGAKYLYDEIDPAVEPFSPENKLLFVTGPLTGTGAPAGNRYVVVTKSPLTGAIANSTAAGEFGSKMTAMDGATRIPIDRQSMDVTFSAPADLPSLGAKLLGPGVTGLTAIANGMHPRRLAAWLNGVDPLQDLRWPRAA